MAISDSLQAVKNRIAAACAAAGRAPDAVRLLVVSKTFPAAAVREAFEAGAQAFGENYVQEGLAKVAELADLRGRIEWHLIGPLQSNKTRPVAEAFDWVHSVDRLKIAERLAEQRPPRPARAAWRRPRCPRSRTASPRCPG
jgi:pyridoxal phosphate enzyme (YggS family)